MRNICFLFVFMWGCTDPLIVLLKLKHASNIRTNKIEIPFNSKYSAKSLSVLPYFVDFRVLHIEGNNLSGVDNFFEVIYQTGVESEYANNTYNYRRSKPHTDSIIKGFKNDLLKRTSKFINTSSDSISSGDSLLIGDYLYELRQCLKVNKLDSVIIPDSIKTIFSKFNKDLILLIDCKYVLDDRYPYGQGNGAALTAYYFFNLKQNKLILFSYIHSSLSQSFSHVNRFSHQYKYLDMGVLTRRVLKYLKQNKKFIEKKIEHEKPT